MIATVVLCILIAMSSYAYAACTKATWTAASNQPAYYRCPLDTDKAALTNVKKDDIAYAEDTTILYIATTATPTWQVVGAAGGSVPIGRTLTIVGTSNQVTVTPATAQDLSANRSWTLSLPTTVATTLFDATTGYRIGGTAASGRYLRGDGSSFVSNTIQAGDLPGTYANSVSNSDGTLTISPITGAVVASLNLSHANTWTGQQTFVAPILGVATGTSLTLSGTGAVLAVTNTYGTAYITDFGFTDDFFLAVQANTGRTSHLWLSEAMVGDGWDINVGNGSSLLKFDQGVFGTTRASLTTAGVFNVDTGYKAGGSATSGHVLRGNGTAFVDAALASADLSDASNIPLLNASNIFTALQKINFNSGTLPSAPSGTLLQLGGADATNSFFVFNSFGSASGIVGIRARGTNASPLALASGNRMAAFIGRGYDGSAYSTDDSGYIGVFAGSAWTSSNHETYIALFTTPNAGTGSGTERARLQLGWMVGTTTDPGAGKIDASNGYLSGGTAGQSVTTTVRDSAGTGTCTLIFTGGLKTGGTC